MTNDQIANDELKSEMVEKEKYLRLAADFENYRKQTDQRITQAVEFGKRVVVEDVAGALDNFDAALGQQLPAPDSEWREGIQQATKEFMRVLEKLGVKRIETKGKGFDPNLMEAVQTKPPDLEEHSGLVESEVRAGYTLNDRVIRPARVIIYQ